MSVAYIRLANLSVFSCSLLSLKQSLRRRVFVRDQYTCAYCRERFMIKELTIDHYVPISEGGRLISLRFLLLDFADDVNIYGCVGSNDISNMVAACRACNLRKGSIVPKDVK